MLKGQNLQPQLSESFSFQEGNIGYYYEYGGEDASGGSVGNERPTYGGPPAHLAHYRPRGAALPSYFASDEIKMTLMSRQHHRLAELNPNLSEVPPQVEGYTELVPLEALNKPPPSMERPGFFMSHPSTVYKAVSTKDGLLYALRRIHNCRLINTKPLGRVEMWKSVQHANVVGLRHVFQTKAFGDFSLVFVYDYHGGAETLKQRHFSHGLSANKLAQDSASQGKGGPPGPPGPPPTGPGGPNGPPPQPWKGMEESFVWGYVIQLSSALRTIHSNGMAATTIDPSKILVSGRSKLLVNCCGVMDVLTFEQTAMNPGSALHNFQQDELISLGRLVVALCCGSLAAAARENIAQSMAFLQHHYSADMKNLVSFLLAPPAPRPKNINDIMPIIGARFYAQLEASQLRIDMIENELAKEIDNGRLFRLLAKLGAINERPEHVGDPSWSETGDRYLLKLFRDFLFHQQTADGRPWLDLAHVVHALNKLDAGSQERLALASHDAHNLLLVTYADLRRCFSQAFQELQSAAAVPASSPQGQPPHPPNMNGFPPPQH